MGGTLDTFIELVFNYPTLSEMYKYAAYDGSRASGRTKDARGLTTKQARKQMSVCAKANRRDWAGSSLIGQADAAQDDLVGAHGCGRLEANIAAVRNEIVLVHAVAADAEAADELAIEVNSFTARKKYDAALIWAGGLRALRAGIRDVVCVKREERARGGAVDARREKRLRAEADGSIGDGCADRNAREIGQNCERRY